MKQLRHKTLRFAFNPDTDLTAMQHDLTIETIRRGGKRALSDVLALAEHSFHEARVTALLDEAYLNPKAHVVGFTGPPGVGKSTLINKLIAAWRASGKTVGVIAVDPSSKKSGGALLGDRTRMITDPEDQGIFVRSLASRGQLGGVSQLTFPALVLMRAIFDVVLIETVGVGQSEADITAHADSVVLCVQPGSGDSLQFMKSGIMEIPDIAVVTKGDIGPIVSRAVADLKGALSLTNTDSRQNGPVVLTVSALKDQGLDGLITAIDDHYSLLSESDLLETEVPDATSEAGDIVLRKETGLASRRAQQAIKWLEGEILKDYGQQGLALVAETLNFEALIAEDSGPFKKQQLLKNGLILSFKG